jgi:hypothetical protein
MEIKIQFIIMEDIMLRKITIIKKVMGEGLKPYGFEYYETRPNTWIFRRRKQEVNQFIDVYQSQYSQAIRLELYTSLDLYDRKEIRQFYPEWAENCGERWFWDFTDKESFIQVLKEFLSIIIECGLNTLDALSIPTRKTLIKAGEEMYRKLYEEHDSLCDSFIKKYSVSINATRQGIEKILQIMRDKKDEDYESMKELLLEMAAYYGNALCYEFRGKWIWDTDRCRLIMYDKFGETNWFPLQNIVVCWRDIEEEGDYLIDIYKQLL